MNEVGQYQSFFLWLSRLRMRYVSMMKELVVRFAISIWKGVGGKSYQKWSDWDCRSSERIRRRRLQGK